MKRQCMYCKTPIYECMGYVLPRDVLAIFDGTFPAGQMPRELCPKQGCNDKWIKEINNELNDSNINI